MKKELKIDSFAGGGGASLGIKWATGDEPDIAINHDAAAMVMHTANHPHTRHVLEDVWRADLKKLTKGRKVGLLWLSPDCKHFSRAKGSKPVDKKIRSLAWVACKWAAQVRPRLIFLENVREIADWGPLVPRWVCRACGWKGTEGQAVLMRVRRKCPTCESRRLTITEDLVPCPDRKGLTFKRFTGRLRNLGYNLEYRNLDVADYGDPTNRRRLFLIARCDGAPIVWPEPTHGNPAKATGRKPWRTAAECIDWDIPCPSIFDRKQPLVPNSLKRIAFGVKRFVIDAKQPFILNLTHGGRLEPIDRPLNTITTAHRGEKAIIVPTLMRQFGNSNGASIELPVPTVMAGGSGKTALVAVALTQSGYGEREGQAPRTLDLEKPLGTVVAGGTKHALVAAFLAKHFGGQVGVPMTYPLPTTTVRGTQNQIVLANLVHMNHGEKQWSAVDEPMRTVTTGNHACLVYSFLTKYFGTAIGQALNMPMHTVTANDRFGLVTVMIDGETYVIVDIGMRMLTPRELARAQGFPDDYVLTGTKTSQVARIGNSVPPGIVRAIVAANYCPQPEFAY